VSTSLKRIGHHSRAIIDSGPAAFRNKVVVAAAATIIIFCCYLLVVRSTRPKPKPKPKPSITLKSIEMLDELTNAERYYAIHRLRHGKQQWRVADRFPRAATVC
jgi:hypothetical protein